MADTGRRCKADIKINIVPMKKDKNKKSKNSRQIVQGGMRVPNGQRLPDVVLQMPEIFLFDMKAYMSSVTLTKSIDYSNRTRLFDMYESATLDLHLSGVLDKRDRKSVV